MDSVWIAWVLIALVNHNPAISSVPSGFEILASPPGRQKALIIPVLWTFYDTYTNFRRVYKHMLILHDWELFGSQIQVTTGEFELQISCIWSNYLTH